MLIAIKNKTNLLCAAEIDLRSERRGTTSHAIKKHQRRRSVVIDDKESQLTVKQ